MPRHTPYHEEKKVGGFICSHCKQWVVINDLIGTANRNHCNLCLWSKHVDIQKGDREADCGGNMEPVGLTFKHEGEGKQGEIMLIHRCTLCGKISINRIAGDDEPEKIMEVFEASQHLDEEAKNKLISENIKLLTENDRTEIRIQLFGRP